MVELFFKIAKAMGKTAILVFSLKCNNLDHSVTLPPPPRHSHPRPLSLEVTKLITRSLTLDSGLLNPNTLIVWENELVSCRQWTRWAENFAGLGSWKTKSESFDPQTHLEIKTDFCFEASHLVDFKVPTFRFVDSSDRLKQSYYFL